MKAPKAPPPRFKVGEAVRMVPGKVETWRDTDTSLLVAQILPHNGREYAYYTVGPEGHGRNLFREDQLQPAPTFSLEELLAAP